MKDRDPSDARAHMQSNSSLAFIACACFTVDARLRQAGLDERDDDNLLLTECDVYVSHLFADEFRVNTFHL